MRCATLARPVLALAALLATSVVCGQAQNAGRNLNVMAVNSLNGQIYSVTFTPPGGSTTVGNTDGSNYRLPVALAFVTNATSNQLDLLVADQLRGALYRYPGALAPQTPPNPTTATLLWNSRSAGSGPVAPDALAVDSYGNLFVASAASDSDDDGDFDWPPQLWEFPVGTAGSGSFAAPVLIDSNFGFGEIPVEVALAPTDVAGASGVAGGDLIVLTTTRVLAYSRSSGFTSRITLFTFPNPLVVHSSLDFWPAGNVTGANYSLLVTTLVSGTVERYYFTNPLTAAPAPFDTGLGLLLYRIRTLYQAGNPLAFVSRPGSILELGATASGSGTLLATVTQNVTTPQGLAVSNAFTNAASACLQPGGCDLTGLLTHTLTNVSTLTGNIVENVCTVTADPRVSFASGAWSCSVPYTPPASLNFTCPPGTPTNGPGCLPVNAVCPGFDDTGKMAIPDTMCGRSGSSGSGFSLIKTLVNPTQFAGGYVQNSAVLANGSNPLCGPGAGADGAFLWAPLQAEGQVFETPNMLDITSGCGSIHGGSDGVSVWGVGLSVNEAAPELTSGGLLLPLENFSQAKYDSLTTTIDNLTQTNPAYPRWTDNYPNIAAAVSLELWGGNVPPSDTSAFGCLDQSWLDFYNATQVDVNGSPQWTADLQNAANLLTGADATGGTTCDGIVINALATNPNAFIQTPDATYPNAPIELNPYGQLRSRLANLYYTLNTRILGNAASTIWPLPVSVDVVPTAVTLASGSSPGSATLSWSTNGASGCTLSSSDGTYQNAALSSPQPLTIPTGDAGSIVTYTVSCSTGPAASSVSAYVTVYPPPTIGVSPSSALLGTAVTLSWNTNHAQGCTASSNDTTPADAFTGVRSGPGSLSLTPATAGSYTYALACTQPATSVSANLTVVPPPTLSASASSAVLGSGATLSWNENGNTGCSWTSTDPAFVAPSASTGTTTVNPASAGSYTYTLSCTVPAGTSPQSVTVTVVQQPTVSVSPTAVIQGSGATLSWNEYGDNGCSWSSTAPAFAVPSAGSGTLSVKPASAGSFTYTLTCAPPTVPATATLTVKAPQPPVLSVSPSSIVEGSAATLSWTINSGDACSASSSGTDTNSADAFSGMKGVSGSMTVTPNQTGSETYTLSCTAPAGVSVSATLAVTPQLARIAIGLSGHDYNDVGDSATLSWSLSGATGCEVTGSFPPKSVPQFAPFPVSSSGSRKVTFEAAGTYTYTLSCSNVSQPAQTSVVIASYCK